MSTRPLIQHREISHEPSNSLSLTHSLIGSREHSQIDTKPWSSQQLIDPHRLSSTRELQTHQKRTRNQKEKYGTSPFDYYSSLCISNCVFTNKLGEVAEDIWPGARPVYSFQLSLPHLITLSSRGFASPSSSSPFPFLLFFSLLYIPLFFLYMLPAHKTGRH